MVLFLRHRNPISFHPYRMKRLQVKKINTMK
jgi:hypothetical protein